MSSMRVGPYLFASAVVAAATLGGLAAAQHASLADEAMLYSLAIVIAAHAGRGPGLVAAGLSVLAFDFVFVEPRGTLAVADTRFLFTFAVMFVVGAAIGTLTVRLKRREHEAMEAALRARTEEVRSSLLSAVSHDLRTPLAVITGMATTLRETALDVQQDGLDTIVTEAERLSRILQNLLAATKVDGGAAPRREWVPVEELVGAALQRLDDALHGRAVRVEIDGDVLAHVDPVLGELLIGNLVDNAAKHTPAGTPIDLTVRREPTSAIIEVADRGPGVHAGDEQRVFEKFFRGANASRAGVGLGLAVCRAIAIAHGGTIETEARDGGGAVFRVRIPDGEAVPALDTPPALTAEAVS
jgi:K+-sensing histidine kinase KdpD